MVSSAIHPIQIEIFERLRVSRDGMRFAEMCPKGIESDIYNYHLQYLVKMGFLEKAGQRYLLTNKGREYIVDLAPLRLGKSPHLKIAAMCMVLREASDGWQILYQKRLREPHFGSRAMVAGGLKRGENLVDAAKRRLNDEAGLNVDFDWVGTLRKIRIRPDTGLVWSDITYQICVAYNPVGTEQTTKFGEHFWVNLKEASRLERTEKVGSIFLSDYLKKLSENPQKPHKGFYKDEVAINEVW